MINFIRAIHGMGLAATRLSIGQHCGIKTFESILNNILANKVEYVKLSSFWAKDSIEFKFMFLGFYIIDLNRILIRWVKADLI
jgi:hypothetical protein